MKISSLIAVLLMFLICARVPDLNAQVELIDEVKISDKGLYFNGQKISSSEVPGYQDKPGYDYFFGRRITPHGDCIARYQKYIFLTWYRGGEGDRHVMLSRYNTDTQSLVTIEFPHQHNGYLNTIHIGESHNTIAVGICKLDSTVHLLYDMHAYSETRPVDGSLSNDYFRYSYSKKGALTVPDEEFTLEQFYPKQLFLKAGEDYKSLTYPRFFENTEGALMVCMREGGHNNGKYMFSKYDLDGWTGWTDFNVLNAKNHPEVSFNWGLYGEIKYQAGKMRIGFHTRYAISTDKHANNNGFHYAYSNDPEGKTDWYNYKDEAISLPVFNPNDLLFYEPADLVSSNATDASHITSGADWTVNDRGDIHFKTRVRESSWIDVHAYKKAEDKEFTITTNIPGGDLYGVGNKIYLISLESGYPTIYMTEGGTNNWEQIYKASSGKRFRHGNVIIDNGILYYYLMEDSSGDAQPIYLQTYELNSDIPVVELRPQQILWISNEDFEQFASSQMNTSIVDSLFILNITGDYPKVTYNSSFDAGPVDKVRIVVKNETMSDIFWFAWYIDGIKAQKRFTPTPSVSDTSFHEYMVDLSTTINWQGKIDYFTLETANKAGTGTVTLDTIEFIKRAEVSIQNVNVDTDGNGTVNPSSGTCYTGREVRFEASPFPGYEFDSWTGDTISTENPLLLTVDSDMNLMANFKLLPPEYIISTYAINGSVELSPYKSSYEEGSIVLLTAVPKSGFVFDFWSRDLSGNENPYLLTMDTSKNITANFIPVRYSLITNSENGRVEQYPDQVDFSAGESVLLKAFPDDGFAFESWSGDITDSVDRVSIVMDSDKEITANFTLVQGLLQAEIPESGMLNPNPSSGLFYLGANIDNVSCYHLFDSKGVEIHSGNFISDKSICIKQKGIYIILLETENGVLSQKLIVQ